MSGRHAVHLLSRGATNIVARSGARRPQQWGHKCQDEDQTQKHEVTAIIDGLITKVNPAVHGFIRGDGVLMRSNHKFRDFF